MCNRPEQQPQEIHIVLNIGRVGVEVRKLKQSVRERIATHRLLTLGITLPILFCASGCICRIKVLHHRLVNSALDGNIRVFEARALIRADHVIRLQRSPPPHMKNLKHRLISSQCCPLD